MNARSSAVLTRLSDCYTFVDASIGQKINPHVSWRVGLDNLGNLRLAEKSPDFGYAIRGRTWFTQLQIEF